MEKEDKGKTEIYSDERILEEMEKRRIETDALRKILIAFEKGKDKEKNRYKPKL